MRLQLWIGPFSIPLSLERERIVQDSVRKELEDLLEKWNDRECFLAKLQHRRERNPTEEVHLSTWEANRGIADSSLVDLLQKLQNVGLLPTWDRSIL